MGDLLERLRQQLLLAIPDDLAEPQVDPQPAPVQPHMRHADRRLLEDGTELIVESLMPSGGVIFSDGVDTSSWLSAGSVLDTARRGALFEGERLKGGERVAIKIIHPEFARGDASIDGAPGKGATVHLLLPAADDVAVAPTTNRQGGGSGVLTACEIEALERRNLIEALERIVTQEGITQILVAGDEVVIPLLREQMPKHLAERIVDHMRMDTNAPLADCRMCRTPAVPKWHKCRTRLFGASRRWSEP